MRFQLRPCRSVRPGPTRPSAGSAERLTTTTCRPSSAVSGPGPGEEVTAGIVVGPAGHLEQPPVARPYPVAGHGGQQPPVPAGQGGVRRFAGPARQEDRRAHSPALELSLVPQRCAREGRDGHRRGPFGVAGEQARNARLVVVLQEADESRLVGELGPQVGADAGTSRPTIRS